MAYYNEFVPKPRGRPRAFAQMGEFDVSLIREFRCRPAFYDRSDASFKDKVYTAHEWQEISNKLGYDVSLLKDRMLQLRNRYNLEKRRLEQLREENPGKAVESPWPLYDMLHFLSDHIRARRSYKRMFPMGNVNSGDMENSQGSNPLSPYAGEQADGAGGGLHTDGNSYENDDDMRADNNAAAMTTVPYANGLCAVKMEENESEHESDSHSGEENTNHSVSMLAQAQFHEQAHSIPHQRLGPKQQQQQQQQQHNVSVALPPSITIRRLDSMRQAANLAAQKSNSLHKHTSKRTHTASQEDASTENITKKPFYGNSREFKYAAFGNFISSSLKELPQQKALLLVEKFTSEIVKVLLQNNVEAEELNDDNESAQ